VVDVVEQVVEFALLVSVVWRIDGDLGLLADGDGDILSECLPAS